MSASMATSTIPSSRTGRPRACRPSTIRDGSHAMTEAEIEEIDRRLRRRRRGAPRRRASTGSSSSPPTTPSSTSSGRRSTTAATTNGAAASRTACASPARIMRAHPQAWPATTSSSAWPSTASRRSRCRCRSTQLQEIIAWHDERQLMDYVTCGTGSYFDFTGIIPNVFYADKLGAPYAEALKQVVKHAQVQCREPYPHAGECRTMSWPRARPTWCRSCAARSPTRISPTRRRRAAPRTSAPASPATRCAGAGAIATTGSPA